MLLKWIGHIYNLFLGLGVSLDLTQTHHIAMCCLQFLSYFFVNLRLRDEKIYNVGLC